MRCEITTISGRTITYDRVTYLEPRLRGDGDEFWLHGYDDGVSHERKSAGHIGTVIVFHDNKGVTHRYEIKSSTDTKIMINEMNFLLKLEETDEV